MSFPAASGACSRRNQPPDGGFRRCPDRAARRSPPGRCLASTTSATRSVRVRVLPGDKRTPPALAHLVDANARVDLPGQGEVPHQPQRLRRSWSAWADSGVGPVRPPRKRSLPAYSASRSTGSSNASACPASAIEEGRRRRPQLRSLSSDAAADARPRQRRGAGTGLDVSTRRPPRSHRSSRCRLDRS